ncbi:hypothetical protein MTO96_048850 [Rhipicephalus appendiculatus]
MASRKRKALSLEEKLDVLHAVDKQPARKKVDIAKDLGLPPSTLNGIIAKRAEIEGNVALFGPKAKQARGAKYGTLDETLLTWFRQARAAGINFDGSILREKAMEVADRLGITDFAASNGWIDRFRKRHGIAYKTHCFARCGFRMNGELDEADEPEAASCEQELTEAMNALGATGVTYDDVVSVDAALVTSECQSITEIVADSVATEAGDSGDDEEPQESGELADPSFPEAVAALDLLRRWASHPQVRVQLRSPSLVRHPVQPNRLVELPSDFSELINEASLFRCPNSDGDDSRSPTLCLICGRILCSQSYCCQVEVGGDRLGACNLHVTVCGAGTGLFLRVRDCKVLLLVGRTKGCYLPPPICRRVW